MEDRNNPLEAELHSKARVVEGGQDESEDDVEGTGHDRLWNGDLNVGSYGGWNSY